MTDIIVIAVLAVLIGGAVYYMIRQKKRGARCIGCSMGGSCGGCCSCGTKETK